MPNHMTFKYYEPSKELGPQHTPEKIKNPGRWRFYEVDLDGVREQVARDIYIGGAEKLTREAFQDHEDFLKLLQLYIDRVNNKKPEPGQYNVKLPEKHLRDIDFDKMQSREAWLDEDLDEKDIEGDVLVLDPTLPPEHVPGPDFAKQVGRPEELIDSDGEPDEIIIDPKLDLVRKREGLGGAIPMEKQLGRPVEIDLDDDADFVVTNEAAAIPNDPSQPRVIAPTFDKQGVRFKYEPE